MSLFVDTSIWYAAADSSDRNNARAKAILKSGETLVTSDHVLLETWTLLHHKLDRKAAERFWEGLPSGIAVIETVTSADPEVAWDLGASWRDQDFLHRGSHEFRCDATSGYQPGRVPRCSFCRISLWSKTAPILSCS
jgi:predicted nucleic acid-binding protein